MRKREVLRFISKQIKKTGLVHFPVEVVLKNGKTTAGHFWFSVSDYINIADCTSGRGQNIKFKDIKSMGSPTIDSLIKILWNQYKIVRAVVAIGKEGGDAYPF